MSDWLHGVQVQPLSVQKIRELANEIRKFSQLELEEPFPVLEFLEISLPKGLDDFDWTVVETLNGGLEACAYPDGCAEHPDGPFITLTQKVYDAAHTKDGRARFTILHECGHIFLHRKVAVHHRGKIGAELKPFENSEWQANTFAAELLMPPESFIEAKSLEEFQARMGVSNHAVKVQARKLLQREDIKSSPWLINL